MSLSGGLLFSNRILRTVEWGQCDPAGIVFFPRYAEMCDAATASLLSAALGESKAATIARYGIIGIPMVSQQSLYTAPCSFGDDLTIESAVVNVGRSSFTIEHRISRSGTLAVTTSEKRVWVARRSADQRDIGGVPLPPEVVSGLSGPPTSERKLEIAE